MASNDFDAWVTDEVNPEGGGGDRLPGSRAGVDEVAQKARPTRMPRRQGGWLTIAAVLVLAGCIAAVLWAAVEHDLLTRRSSHFSVERFQSVHTGDSLQDVIELLGPPISSYQLQDGGRGTDPATTMYYFMGEAPPWWPFYTEAMVLTDSQDRVVRTFLNEEP